MKPLGNRIIVKPILPDQVLASGIVLPQPLDVNHAVGEVVARGERVGDYLREGTRVFHSINGIQTFKHEGQEYASLSEESVMFAVDDFNVMDDS